MYSFHSSHKIWISGIRAVCSMMQEHQYQLIKRASAKAKKTAGRRPAQNLLKNHLETVARTLMRKFNEAHL
jgi:hypothetical protein